MASKYSRGHYLGALDPACDPCQIYKSNPKIFGTRGGKLSWDQRKAKWLLESVLSMNGSHTIVIDSLIMHKQLERE